jgi:hypothetical protein
MLSKSQDQPLLATSSAAEPLLCLLASLGACQSVFACQHPFGAPCPLVDESLWVSLPSAVEVNMVACAVDRAAAQHRKLAGLQLQCTRRSSGGSSSSSGSRNTV